MEGLYWALAAVMVYVAMGFVVSALEARILPKSNDHWLTFAIWPVLILCLILMICIGFVMWLWHAIAGKDWR